VGEPRSVDLTVRAGAGDTLILRASNDTVVDRYGTVITAEALLRDWWPAYQQHRTVSLQHNLPRLREIEGRPMVGLATRVDFTPQLEVEVKVLDQRTLDLVRAGKVRSASLEFVPLEVERRTVEGKPAEVYHRLSPEPEHAGLSLVDVPGVPGADLLNIRTLPALWAFAVVDPKVLNGEVTDPDLVRQLAWLPHHDERSHAVDEQLLARALADLEAGRVHVPAHASLSPAQVLERARAHLERHTSLRLGRRAEAETPKEGEMKDKWIQARAAQYQAEGLNEQDAAAKAKADYDKLAPDVRAKLEGKATDQATGDDTEAKGLLARLFGGRAAGGDVHVHLTQPAPDAQVQARAEREAKPDQDTKAEEKPAVGQAQARTARDEWLEARAALLQVEEGLTPAQARTAAQEQLDADLGLQARLAAAPAPTAAAGDAVAHLPPEIRALLARPEQPMAAIASGLRVRSPRLEGDQLLAEVLMRTVVPQVGRQRPSTRQLTEAYNMLAEAGIHSRALSIETDGTVIREELARQFVVKPEPDVVFRNHMRSVPMAGVKKQTFPRFDRAGITHEWGRTSTDPITDSEPTLDTFDIEVSELNSKVVVPDSFQMFNAQGMSFVAQNLLPAMRGAAQYEEDRAFFMSTGTATDPATFKGLRSVTGVTSVSASTNGDAFDLSILSSLLRAMPVAFRSDVARLAFYMPISLADDFAEIISERATVLGDRLLSEASGVGPRAFGMYRGVPVYGISHLPNNETQGGSTDCGTVFLVHRDIPVIGDALTIRIEPYRRENFIDVLQLQAWVGLGYQFPAGVVRRVGVRPRLQGE